MNISTNTNDTLIRKKTEQINKILTVLNKSKISRENYESTSIPFFFRDFDPVSFNINSKSLYNYNIPDSLNRNVKLIFELLGDTEREIYIGEWTIMSLKECIKRYDHFCKNGQKNVFDIGYKYMGLGHIQVISCDLKTHLLFYRHDGGSNVHDRNANYQDILKNGPDKYDKFFFSKWFYNINI